MLQSIEEKSQAFVQRLIDKHPGLTQGVIHLATLLHVNMNRYRLRKALQLEGEDDLVEYLSQF